MKKIISIILLSAMTLLSLCACGQDELVGTWNIKGRSGSEIVFYEDGTYELKYYTDTESVGEYTKIGTNKVRITEGDDVSGTFTYTLDKTNKTISIENIESY